MKPSTLSNIFMAWRARLTGMTARIGAWSVADQAVVSGTSFITALALARFTDMSEFGAYVLAFCVLLFVNELQVALITGPMAVLGASKSEEDFHRYVGTLLLLQFGVGAVLAVLTLAAVGVMSFMHVSVGLRGTFLGMAVAVFFVQTREFCRRVLFTKLMPARVLANDVVYCVLQLVGIYVLWWIDINVCFEAGLWLSSRNVFFCMAISALVGSLMGLGQISPFIDRSLVDGRMYLKENWNFGKWGLGSVLGGSLYKQINVIVVGAFAGTAEVAMFEAPRLLLAPLQVLILGGINIVTPKASEKYHKGGKKALLKFFTPMILLWAIIFVGYAMIIGCAPTFWLNLFYGTKYEGVGFVLLVWILVYTLLGTRTLLSIALAVIRRPDTVMYVSIVVGAVAIATSIWLSPLYGSSGAAIARLVAEVLLVCTMAFLCWRFARQGVDLRAPIEM